MSQSWVRVLSARWRIYVIGLLHGSSSSLQTHVNNINLIPNFYKQTRHHSHLKISFLGSCFKAVIANSYKIVHLGHKFSTRSISSLNLTSVLRASRGFWSVSEKETLDSFCGSSDDVRDNAVTSDIDFDVDVLDDKKAKVVYEKPIDLTKIDINLRPTVMIIGRPNVGKSALFNRLIRRREALVYNTPDDHVTRDIREGIAKIGDLLFRVLDSAGLEAEASSRSIIGRTTAMTANVLAK